MEKTVYIYIILNPITNEVRYVGKTTNIKRRLYQHLHTKLNSYCSKWIFSLLKQNIIPEGIITEDHWINHNSCDAYVEVHMEDTADADPLDTWIRETYPELLDEESFFIHLDY